MKIIIEESDHASLDPGTYAFKEWRVQQTAIGPSAFSLEGYIGECILEAYDLHKAIFPGEKVYNWNDPRSNPVEDIRAAVNQVHSATGNRPNKLIMSPAAAAMASGARDQAILNMIEARAKSRSRGNEPMAIPEWLMEEVERRESEKAWENISDDAREFKLRDKDWPHANQTPTNPADCPECYGTTFTNGIGGPCSKGCR